MDSSIATTSKRRTGRRPLKLTRKEAQAVTRERVLAAAMELFSAHGYRAVTMATIAKEAGFTTGALYSNFKNKEDLFMAVVAREGEEHGLFINTAAPPEASLVDWVETIARRMTWRLTERTGINEALMEFLLDSRDRPEIMAAAEAAYIGSTASFIDDLLPRMKAEGHVLPCSPEFLAAQVNMLGVGMIFHNLIPNAPSTAEAHRAGLFQLLGIPLPHRD